MSDNILRKLPSHRHLRWRDSLLSIPKKWLSTAESVDEFGFPDTLPKVPVPPLEQTMADYVLALEPITTPSQLERTKGIIKQFSSPQGLGPRLHQYLLDKRESEDNWVSILLINEQKLIKQAEQSSALDSNIPWA
ncbi:hypothetical protein ACLKA6_009597 [Drosophila palustris]